ncbi:MAG: rhodanese-like domain-containing protein [Halorhodospira sp.]
MSDLLSWLAANPLTTVLLLGVAALVGFRLTRRYRPISAAEAGQRLDDGRTCFVDVRTPGEVAGGAIPGAIHVPMPQLRQRLGELRERAAGGPVVVYCHSGLRGASAAYLLARKGVGEVYNLRGGIVAWRHQGLPVADGDG